MKFLQLLLILISAPTVLAVEDLSLGDSTSVEKRLITIHLDRLELLRDGKNPEAVWRNLNELNYLAHAGSRMALDTFFNTLVEVIDNKETVADCNQQVPRYSIGALLRPLSVNGQIWDYVRKLDKQFCYRVQAVYQQSPLLYQSEHENPSEIDMCGLIFKS